jgi:FKBP-type peptidyl-prolyl cis-trans isomerase SlyD
MIVSKEKIVSLVYELRLDHPEGEIIETINTSSPLTFLYGSGGLLPKFEENIKGLKVGDNFDFNLSTQEAYGEVNADAIVTIPISAFEIEGKIDTNILKIGNRIPMQDASGNKLTGIVQDIADKHVVMDFNHPLAGSTLYFKGEITGIRDATDDEMHHGHTHSAGGCEGCSECRSPDEQCC